MAKKTAPQKKKIEVFILKITGNDKAPEIEISSAKTIPPLSLTSTVPNFVEKVADQKEFTAIVISGGTVPRLFQKDETLATGDLVIIFDKKVSVSTFDCKPCEEGFVLSLTPSKE